ncbi:mandelate racemase/muconate lactonizing enzyme family protein [Ensifer sp. 4252]|uniref:mandelate racemase/muconate lactonizing enzyme family protein n=1 Tax=Ensifer sp. 4252 TaxID=3373915 RepID=UPI003D19AFD5
MKIKSIRTTPLYCRLAEPYHWSHGIKEGAEIVLVEIETDTGVTGFGEILGTPNNATKIAVVDYWRTFLVGSSAYDIKRLSALCHQLGFISQGAGSAPRFFAQCFAGIEMALWDALGKQHGVAAHKLLGGALRESISYFGFIQGSTTDDLARCAESLCNKGYSTLYLKVGRGENADISNVKAVRHAIGNRRLRLDANEKWDMLTASRMIKLLAPYDIEMMEQPISSASGPEGLRQLRSGSPIPIAADQAVFTLGDIYRTVRNEAADLIVLGIHESGGIDGFIKSASIAEAATVNICNHAVFESGITSCAFIQAAACIPNLDDANQITSQLLEEDLVREPNLEPVEGKISVANGPGLGFELNTAAVERASKAYISLI